MPRAIYEKHLKSLHEDVLQLGDMVEKAINHSIEALKKRDLAMAKQIVEEDVNINNKRFDIEQRCIQLIATQQPMAKDLRAIIAILHIIVDLERMGDYAEGISRINILMGDEPLLKPLIDIPRMAQKAVEMLDRSLQAFIKEDVEEARRIPKEDDEVDALWNQVYRELIFFMIQDPRTISRATYLMWVAHNLERIADRATNICERVVFTATGKMEEIGASRY
ncbi:MAG: phosphate signaling complex protein PhoU [Chloroflexi bacterium]|nr:phosphate signaling complex protein PhoU [Chloroflexota bacterium]